MFHAAGLRPLAHAAVDAGDSALPGIRFRGQMWTGFVSNGLARIEKWFRRGAWEDGQVLYFDDDWRFPYGGEHLSSVEIWSQGQIYPSEKSPDPVVSLITPLSLKSGETEVFCGRTAGNGYRIEWHNAHQNRDAVQLADAAIELRRNGDCVVTENGVTTVVPYDVPFPHDGFGQDADWVRANFTNADEILATGYGNWVDGQVGIGETNGLYKFTAYFAEDPPEATELYVGDYTVAVTNAGEYVFVLEKGTKYEFGTWPHDADVEYWAQDDMAWDAPLLTSWWGYWYSFGTWTEDENSDWGIRKEGDTNHVGVAATQSQLDLRAAARANLGITDYAFKAILPARNGFSSVDSDEWKCNAFVADMAISAGLSIPSLHKIPPCDRWSRACRHCRF